MNNNHNLTKEHAIHTNPPYFITAKSLKTLRTTGSIAGQIK